MDEDPPSDGRFRLDVTRSDMTGLVLAGGRGSRMGGADKGLQLYRGNPLARHAWQRLSLQVDSVMINANRHLDEYAAWGAPVWPDVVPDYAGPLAGFLTGLQHCQTRYLVTVPCDTPEFPNDLVVRLAQAMTAVRVGAPTDITMACCIESGVMRRQPVFCLIDTRLTDSLALYIDQGGRKIDLWATQHRCIDVPFDTPRAFFNVNTTEELLWLESATHSDGSDKDGRQCP